MRARRILLLAVACALLLSLAGAASLAFANTDRTVADADADADRGVDISQHILGYAPRHRPAPSRSHGSTSDARALRRSATTTTDAPAKPLPLRRPQARWGRPASPTRPKLSIPTHGRPPLMSALPLPTGGVLTTPVPPPPAYAPGPIVQIATLRIPRVGLVAPLYEGVTLTVLNHGPGHWPGSANPGKWGNVVIGGHRTTYSQPFLNIDLLAPGSQIMFDLPDGTEATYAVTGTQIVPPTALWIVNQTPGNTVTLFACHPKGSAAQRIVVRGTLVSLRRH